MIDAGIMHAAKQDCMFICFSGVAGSNVNLFLRLSKPSW